MYSFMLICLAFDTRFGVLRRPSLFAYVGHIMPISDLQVISVISFNLFICPIMRHRCEHCVSLRNYVWAIWKFKFTAR